MDNLMENNTLEQIDGNYTFKKLVWTILWKIGARLDKFVVLKNVGKKRNTYGTTTVREREAYCEAKQIRLAARNTNLWNNPLVRQVRTNEVSEHMLQK